MTMKKKTILVIEDEIGPREAIRIILQKYYSVTTAKTGKEALRILENNSFDLITIDLKLPDLLGSKLLKTLSSRFPDCEFMVITGYSSYDNMVEIFLSGVPIVLIKPFEISDLHQAIQHAFKRKKLKSQINKFNTWFQETLSAHDINSKSDHRKIFTSLKKKVSRIERMTGHFDSYGNTVWKMAKKICGKMGFTEKEWINLEFCCYLHHLGKLGFCYPISTKEKPKTTAEQILLKTYSHQTAKLLKGSATPAEILEIILHAEEHFDGTGYPSGIKGVEIPVQSQIIHFCSHLLSLMDSCSHPHDKAPSEEIIELIKIQRGKALAPNVVDAFIKTVDSGQINKQSAQG